MFALSIWAIYPLSCYNGEFPKSHILVNGHSIHVLKWSKVESGGYSQFFIFHTTNIFVFGLVHPTGVYTNLFWALFMWKVWIWAIFFLLAPLVSFHRGVDLSLSSVWGSQNNDCGFGWTYIKAPNLASWGHCFSSFMVLSCFLNFQAEWIMYGWSGTVCGWYGIDQITF